MTSKLTREFMQNIISGHGFGVAPSAVKAMAEYIVAAMDSEPAARMVVIPTIWKHYTAAKTATIYEKAMTDAGIEWRSIDD